MLLAVPVSDTSVTFAAALVLVADKVTTAVWPTLTPAMSASATFAVSCKRLRSEITIRPEEDEDDDEDVELPVPVELPDELLLELDALELDDPLETVSPTAAEMDSTVPA